MTLEDNSALEVRFSRLRIKTEARRLYGTDILVNEWKYYAAIRSLYHRLAERHDISLVTSKETHEYVDSSGITRTDRNLTLAIVTLYEARLTEIPTSKKEPPMSQLYKLVRNGKDMYVVRLATDSSNKAVVEDKTSGEVFSVNPAELELIVPYTVGVKFPSSSTIYHYLAKKGAVEVGDILIQSDGGFAMVKAIDTKYASHTKDLAKEFRLVLSKEIDA